MSERKMGAKKYIKEVNRVVGRQIRKKRNKMGMTMRELGLKVGVSVQQIYKYENGEDNISVGRLALIAKALDERVNYFFENMLSSERKVMDLLEQKNDDGLHLDVIRGVSKIENEQKLKKLKKIIDGMLCIKKTNNH